MQARFYIDPATDSLHIHGHDVSENEVLEVLEQPYEDRRGRKGSRIVLGQTVAGRYLRVIYVPVITAYELTGKPLAALRRRRKRKNQ